MPTLLIDKPALHTSAGLPAGPDQGVIEEARRRQRTRRIRIVVSALLATALFVVPAATVRLWTERLPVWQLASVALAAAQGIAGLWLSVELNTPPGPTVTPVTAVAEDWPR